MAQQTEHISFFDAIDANKRNSVIFIFIISMLFMILVGVVSYIFDIGVFGYILGFIVLAFYALLMYYKGDSIILGLSSAKEAKREEYPFLYDTVEGLSLASQIPMPKIYIITDQSPNAFATGRDPKHSSVAVTTGLLQIMNHDELAGVIAHEISHIGNYDIRFSMVAIVFAGAMGLIASFVWRSMFFGMRGGGNRDRRGGGLFLIIGLIFVILAPIFTEIVRLALSRERESLADANGARITRYPEGLASALEKIKQANIPTTTANDTTAPLYFSNPFPNKFGSLFSTHPPIDERIKRLREM